MPDYTITLRPYTAADISFIQTVYASSRQVEMDMVPWSAEEKSRFLNMQCQAQLQHYQTHYLNATHDIILCNGQPIGRLYVNRNAQEIRLMDITLLPDYRKLGIGSQIIRAIMYEGGIVSLPVTLHVEIINPDAIRLYQRLGFTAVADKGVHIFMERLPQSAAVPQFKEDI
jgi:GNAT superfamily N-acetyltransferase